MSFTLLVVARFCDGSNFCLDASALITFELRKQGPVLIGILPLAGKTAAIVRKMLQW
jgi:hypothetical protein